MQEVKTSSMEHILRVGGKNLIITAKPYKENAIAFCPEGRKYHVDFKKNKIFHRNKEGKIQVNGFK